MMNENGYLIVDNCSACESINKLIEKLLEKGSMILESKLEDYHVCQLYFKMNTTIDVLKEIDTAGFSEKDNFLICDCHWSRIEFLKEQIEYGNYFIRME